jgi:hypothetical protein
MKKIFSLIILSLFVLNSENVIAYTQKEKLAADFLSYKDVINTQEGEKEYNLDKKITRREMAKITLKLSNINIWNTCLWMYKDLQISDWGCKYAEIGLKNLFFAKNANFNPNNNISKIESLKMIMKWRKISKDITIDWRKGYVTSAIKSWLIEEKFSDYDTLATRWWIFKIAQNAIQYSWNDESIEIIEELLSI